MPSARHPRRWAAGIAAGAPRPAIIEVLRRHPEVRDLFDNGWLHLFALDDAGRMAWRYVAGQTWLAMGPAADQAARGVEAVMG